MTFLQLAFRNVRGGWRRYSAFMLSSVFSVMVFFIYAAFIFHPQVAGGSFRFASGVRSGMLACLVLIAVFSFFFSLYSFAAFLRSREREFGLLTLLGMTRGQLRRLVLGENTVLSLMAIAGGIGLGALLSKLFFMALMDLLGMPGLLSFAIPAKAVAVTGAGFFALFLGIAALTLHRVGRTEIVDLMKAASKPRPAPRLSGLAAAAGFLCLGGGYYLAATASMETIALRFLPVIGIVTVGTHLLFAQGSVGVLRRLHRSRAFSYRGTNLVTLSQLVFRIRDNARVLFVVTILSAVVLTASGTVYVFAQSFGRQSLEASPQALGWTVRGEEAVMPDPAAVERLLAAAGVEIAYPLHVEGIEVPVPAPNVQRALALPLAAYNELAARAGYEALPGLAPGEAMLVTRHPGTPAYVPAGTGLKVASPDGVDVLALRLAGQRAAYVTLPLPDAEFLLAVTEPDFSRLAAVQPATAHVTLHAYQLTDWFAAEAAVAEIAALVPPSHRAHFTEHVTSYIALVQATDLTMFLGTFMSVLFFLATGSLLYFKLYTELQDDQAQFRALARIGISPDEIRRIVTRQTAVLFFLPCLVAVIHTAFAMQALGNSLNVAVWQHAGAVLGIWLALQTGYFLAARATYVRSLAEPVQ